MLISIMMCKDIALEKVFKINAILDRSKCVHHGFLGGSSGLLYYYYNAAKLLNDQKINKKADELLTNIFEDVNNSGGNLHGATYSGGAAGFGYVINYLHINKLIDFEIEAEFTDLDKFLFDEALVQFEKNNIDFLHGAMGVFHYFNSREQSASVKKYLELLADNFCNKAIIGVKGIWFCNLGLERLTKNHVDFGLAHGLSGFLLLLIEAWSHLDNKLRLEKIITSGIEYIINNQHSINYSKKIYSFFPNTIMLNSPEVNRSNRLAWCYGDLNQVLLLYRAGKLLGSSTYTDIANKIGFQSEKRKSVEQTLAVDSHLCHGIAGLAQFYKCLYNETLIYIYYEAYEYWIKKILLVIDKEIESNKYSANPISVLEGWTGVALVLAEYISDEKLTWSKAFLL